MSDLLYIDSGDKIEINYCDSNGMPKVHKVEFISIVYCMVEGYNEPQICLRCVDWSKPGDQIDLIPCKSVSKVISLL